MNIEYPKDDICPIWGSSAKSKYVENLMSFIADSPRAGGKYRILIDAWMDQEKWELQSKARLTTWLVEQRRLGVEVPTVDLQVLEYCKNRGDLSALRRAEAFLEYCTSREKKIGTLFYFTANESSLAWTESTESFELLFLADTLVQRGWAHLHAAPRGSIYSAIVISIQGYEHLDSIRSKRIISSQAFVAMWFDPSLNEAYSSGIKPGIEDAGYDCIRVDSIEHNSKIDDTIIAEIRRSRFLVADFTYGDRGHRGGVYYEAGFAHGLNIPVIFTCRQDLLEKVHFDTRQFNHIGWTTPEELRKRLSDRISATIGDGPKRLK